DSAGVPPAAATPTLLCPANQVAVAHGRAVFLRPESAGATPSLSNCPAGTAVAGGVDLSGDADASDQVVHLWPGTGAAQNLSLAATAVAITDTTSPAATYVAAIVETGVVQSHPLSGGGWTPVPDSLKGSALKACGAVFAFLTPEASISQDLNNDGDETDDDILVVFDPSTNTIVNTQQAAREFVCNAYVIAFRTEEADQGGFDLQHGTPAVGFSNNVLQAYDLMRPECLEQEHPTDCVVNSTYAVTPCRLEACDPRQPYRVIGTTVRFLTAECDQRGSVSDGCEGQSGT